MSATLPYASSRDSVRIPTVWLAAAISLVLHGLLLWGLPRPDPADLPNPFESDRMGQQSGSLALRLAPPPRAAPAPPAAAAEPPSAAAPAPRAPLRKEKVLTTERPAAAALPVAPPKPAAPPPAPSPTPAEAARPAPPPMDFAAMVEARRRARAPETGPRPPDPRPQETEQERHSRQVAENLGLNRAPSFGTNKNAGGGVFQVIRLTPEEASFAFFGWNRQIRRNSMQTLDVKRGEHPTIELAVVRRMIAVIRETTTGDFTWESQRLGRDVELSARVADQAQLENFLQAEFFSRR